MAGRLLGLLHELSWCDRNGTHRAEVLEHLRLMRNAIGAANHSPADRKNLLDQADSIAALGAEKGD
ncbi:hypothetical protein QMY03_09260 [Arthrobacter sp. KFRI-F3372]|uniref:hypothetical protein n=1 Tax=Micrococcaceae TaxID=1268 RepID=UPI0027815E0E|nr:MULTISPECIES: hypothetical protein [Micrococcaceae]MDP9989002.1 hypothetical protein [Arthrobacter oryzae]MEE2523902.1 hypothetical protein [Pseudarthrobacter sp. J47]WHP61069.1 hypothetical protein QMY03_09260 [Arthrobacter sp. KFRI-F3372]